MSVWAGYPRLRPSLDLDSSTLLTLLRPRLITELGIFRYSQVQGIEAQLVPCNVHLVLVLDWTEVSLRECSVKQTVVAGPLIGIS